MMIEELRIDWQLFAAQKLWLIGMAGTPDRDPAEVEILDGVINMMDAIQDAAQASLDASHARLSEVSS
jgi:hypothetical protein